MDDRIQQLEEQIRSTPEPTRRPTVPAMEERLFRIHPVLDHGFVRVVDYMGDDAAIVQAARVSYGRGTRSINNDRGLIRYLMRHRHTTPLEMCEIKLHVKLPIFIARQWIRHRTASVNEYSARYSILDREFYLPDPSTISVQSNTNRQGRGDNVSHEQADRVLALLKRDAMGAYETYEALLNDTGDGNRVDEDAPQIARELARVNLTLNYYTQWYWKLDLHNLLHFLSLRMDPHAQYEIRAYADIIGDIVADWCPIAWEAFKDYRVNAMGLSGTEIDIVRRGLKGENVHALLKASNLSAREKREFLEKLDLPEPADGSGA